MNTYTLSRKLRQKNSNGPTVPKQDYHALSHIGKFALNSCTDHHYILCIITRFHLLLGVQISPSPPEKVQELQGFLDFLLSTQISAQIVFHSDSMNRCILSALSFIMVSVPDLAVQLPLRPADTQRAAGRRIWIHIVLPHTT